ncbi:MAG: glycosyltransferase family 4 protein [Deltaproteobacteria bacterium]|nr:glycosyltransferase family 4 protein [Deltaproteobacteria bacterium]
MRILHVSGAYVPSARASSVAVMKMCEAIAREGHEVIALAKAPEGFESEDPFEFYGVARSFELVRLARPQVRGGSAVLLARQLRELIRRRGRLDLVYSRDVVAAAAAARFGLEVLYEAHEPPSTRLGALAFEALIRSPRLVRLVTLTRALANELERRSSLFWDDSTRGARRETLIAPSAADPIPSEVVPAPLRSPGRPLVGYVGSLYSGKGVEVVLEAARQLPQVDFVIVGGRPHEVDELRPRVGRNVRLVGFVSHKELASYYQALDVALLPNRGEFVATPGGRVDISRWTSPLKMLEYMGSRAAIVASDLPVLREVLVHETTALLVGPSASEWVRAIERLLADPSLAARLSAEARRQLVELYTYEARARHVLQGLPQRAPGFAKT